MHARKAWLKGLSPKENREVPPLDYERVYRLKAAHPRLTVVLNGGIGSVEEALAHLAHVDGVMLGRAAYQEPWRLLAVDPLFFGEAARFASPKEGRRGVAFLTSSVNWRKARGFTPSPGICTGYSAPCRGRAPSAGISPVPRRRPMPAPNFLKLRWRWCRTALWKGNAIALWRMSRLRSPLTDNRAATAGRRVPPSSAAG